MMPAPPTLTLASLDEGQDTSVMSLTAGAGATSARVAAAPGRRGSLLTASRQSGMILGRGWPGDEQTPRAAAPPVRAGDAVVLYYSQTRSRQEAGLFHFREVRAKEAIMARTRTQERAGGMGAAIYARVSDKSQDTEDKTSISEQISDMETHCERRGLTITARYQEVGRGWSKKRHEFQRMLADARRERFDTIVCWKSDRLSRGMYPAAALMEVVEARQIRLEAVMDAIDMKTFGLMAAIGKIELDNFRERAAMGKRGSAKQGRMPAGAAPYGYRTGDDGKPEIYGPEADVVRRIFRMYVHQGLAGTAICQQLTSDNTPLRNPGSRWHKAYINDILGREVYKGTWHYGKARWVVTEAGERVYPQPEDRWIQVPFPPLVEEETWDRAQAIKNQRRQKSNRNTKIFYLLQHLVRCAECGMLFACRSSTHTYFRRKGNVRKQARGTPQRHYHCYGMLREHMGCRKPAMIRAEQLEELVWNQVKGMVQNPELIVAGIESLDAQEDGGLAEQAVRAERDLHRIQVEEERAIRLYVSGKITENQLDQQRRFITERLEAARATLNDLRARESMASDKRTLIQNLVQWAGKFGRGLDDLPQEKRRDVLRLIVDQVLIDRDNNVSITLGIPTENFTSIEKEESPSPCPTKAAYPAGTRRR